MHSENEFGVPSVARLFLETTCSRVEDRVINSVLLHLLRFRDPASLVLVTSDDPALGLHGVEFSVPGIRGYEIEARCF